MLHGKNMATEFFHDDLISPTRIEHFVEKMVEDGEQQYCYNYLVYHFDKYNAHLVARAYLDEIDHVNVYGPFADLNRRQLVSEPRLYEEVLAYLKRRYHSISRFGDAEYVIVWKRSNE